MHNLPTPIWNEIAKTQTLRHARWRKLFAAEGMDFLTLVDELEKEIDAKAKDSRVTRGYCLVAPLLQENVAISRYVEAKRAPSLRGSLPELTTISEAVDLATQEFQLTPGQRQTLRSLLESAY